MIFFDGTRITAPFRELYKFVLSKGIPVTSLQTDGGLFAYLGKPFQKVVEKSSGVKRVDADEFNRSMPHMTENELLDAIQAYHETIASKQVSYADNERKRPITQKNGKKWVMAGSYRKGTTGELELFREIWLERMAEDGKVYSEISGEPLIQNPKHHLWVNQFAHCLGKSVGEEYRLRKDNIFLMLPAEHHEQTINPGKCRLDHQWKNFFERYDQLKHEYEKELRNKHGKK